MIGRGRRSRHSGTQILLVEDDRPTLEILSLHLGRFYTIVACIRGETALEALRSNRYISVIVTDLRMPGVNGYDILRWTAENAWRPDRTFPAVVLTGHATPEDEQRARSLGVTQFQRKPIDLRQLWDAIETCRGATEGHSLGRAGIVQEVEEWTS
ncbi:response regulator [Reyranella sp.]|jgi:CheY-like chemotaxis protein|uniref:response regulator n=1 Tax=Reyranella sp. TaxID=1929291 RepID=UPI000BD739FE|nr:response regulator [Reyranella sp.]OYY36215.1 MAG: hypothetical protein B7Y57_24810 [Rhodospirillales bacterium 35-66-84]OYZ91125.1 MAG: hypothetical protein B7Y08_27100 [Rhodospirillales bacterium 24-66-33]OZB22622.1 MAG: hypothetical protein B7X63_22150 [Rhodospirillales bacterium 39-66-50]HQS18704.1 response regulator [Reyranella sp.]HQT15172.1 response regulator [Reyranella sp.]